MFKYLSEYRIADMRELVKNGTTPHRRSPALLHGKTAVITGATSGVGLAAARELARAGCSLVLIARNEEKAQGVCDGLVRQFGCAARYYLADFSDLSQVHQVAVQIRRHEPRIDILINSAGVFSTRRRYTASGAELVFCVNHLAPFILTHRLIPRLKERDQARIIQVNSQGHRFNGLDTSDLDWRRRLYTGMRSYGASKTAQLLTVWEFAERLAGTPVTINGMHPGEVKSAIGSNNGRFYNWYKRHVLWRLLKDPAISGEAIHFLAADPAIAGVTGAYFNLTHLEKPAPPALDRDVGRIIWQETLRMTGLSDEV